MKNRSSRIRRILLSALALLALLLGPHVYCRLTADRAAVQVKTLGVNVAPPSDEFLRVGTLNIAHGRGPVPDSPNNTGESPAVRLERLKAIGKLIQMQSLDIAVLNEVDFDAYWSHGIDQSEVIAEAAGLPHVLKQRNGDILVPFRTLRFGNAILSRYPVSEAKFLKLPVFKQWEDILGGAHHSAACIITLPGGEKIQVIAVHLEVLDEATRIAGVRTIAAAVSQSGIPSLVLGDFNSFPAVDSANAITTFIERTRLSPIAGTTLSEQTFTFPSHQPDRRLDWIFTPAHWNVRSWKIHSTDLSDHSFVTAVIARQVLSR